MDRSGLALGRTPFPSWACSCSRVLCSYECPALCRTSAAYRPSPGRPPVRGGHCPRRRLTRVPLVATRVLQPQRELGVPRTIVPVLRARSQTAVSGQAFSRRALARAPACGSLPVSTTEAAGPAGPEHPVGAGRPRWPPDGCAADARVSVASESKADALPLGVCSRCPSLPTRLGRAPAIRWRRQEGGAVSPELQLG